MFQKPDARFIMQTINTGTIHFVQNFDCEQAVFVSAFDSEDPSVYKKEHIFFWYIKFNITEQFQKFIIR